VSATVLILGDHGWALLMRFDVINPGPALDRERLDLYLEEHSLTVPESLASQLLEQNGGAPRDDLLVRVGDDETELSSFFGVDMPDQATELAWNAATLVGRIPDGMCAFADDAGGNLFLIETGDRNDGAVWFWDHEREGECDAAVKAAPSLDEFLASLEARGELE
jgi:SMI1 / KNR4 family (SUKH-1)